MAERGWQTVSTSLFINTEQMLKQILKPFDLALKSNTGYAWLILVPNLTLDGGKLF